MGHDRICRSRIQAGMGDGSQVQVRSGRQIEEDWEDGKRLQAQRRHQVRRIDGVDRRRQVGSGEVRMEQGHVRMAEAVQSWNELFVQIGA